MNRKYVQCVCTVFILMSPGGDYGCVDKTCAVKYFSELPLPSPPWAH